MLKTKSPLLAPLPPIGGIERSFFPLITDDAKVNKSPLGDLGAEGVIKSPSGDLGAKNEHL